MRTIHRRKAIFSGLGLLGLAGLASLGSSLQAQPPGYRQPFPSPYPQPYPQPRFDAWRIFELNNSLIEKTELFLDRFHPRCNDVPQGFLIERNARELLDEARDLRRAIQRGASVQRIVGEFQALQGDCDRLVGRVQRIAGGGWGPNIALVNEIGRTCALMRRAFGDAC